MYNKTIHIMRQRWFNKEPTSTNFKYLRTYCLKEEKNSIMKQYNAPSHMLDGAIKLACASYKSAFSNFKNGHIRHFNIRYLKKNKKSHIFDIEKMCFNETSFYSSFLGKKILNKENFSYKNINHDSKLHYNTETKIFTLLIPENVEIIENINNNEYISIDPGIRTFLTCLTNNSNFEINNNNQSLIKSKLLEMDKIDNKKKIKNKKEVLRKRSLKIQNLITDLHWKSVNYLMKKEQTNIIIGNWSTKNCINRSNNLNKMTKRIASRLRYYEFLQKLKYKCNQYNKNIQIIDESYSSKLCSNCCEENKTLGSSKIFRCNNCKLIFDRDINGCRNILMKSFSNNFNIKTN